ncbi:MAG: hypothetical protein J2P25_25065 [Nocardiopsaceae bacterium]|nr:hypothetical protein [Nocardiopsaceae bacterium]
MPVGPAVDQAAKQAAQAMLGTSQGFAVDRAALAETAKGLNDVIGQLKGLGFDETAEIGRGFSGLALSEAQLGNGILASAFSGFCDRWSWGVRALVQDGDQFAQRLGLCAGAYNDAENQAIGAVKDLVAGVAGDPHMTDQQAESASWSQDASAVTTFHNPLQDFTPQAAQQNAQTIEKQWEGVGQNMMNRAKQAVQDPGGAATQMATGGGL